MLVEPDSKRGAPPKISSSLRSPQQASQQTTYMNCVPSSWNERSRTALSSRTLTPVKTHSFQPQESNLTSEMITSRCRPLKSPATSLCHDKIEAIKELSYQSVSQQDLGYLSAQMAIGWELVTARHKIVYNHCPLRWGLGGGGGL